MTAQTTPPNPYPHLPVRSDWLARRTERAIEPDLPIVDPHHHLWDRPRFPYTVTELADDIGSVEGGGHNVVSTVFVECRAMYRAHGDKAMRVVGETEFVVGQAAMAESGYYGKARACAAIVGHIDLTLAERAGAVADAHIAAGGGRFRGVRHASAHDPAPEVRTTSTTPPAGLLADSGFRRGFAELARRKLSFDAWLYHPQIPELADLAAAFADTTIVLDHCGGPLGVGPYSRKAIFEGWRKSIHELARRPNVVVKLGGLGMAVNGYDFHEQDDPPQSQTLADAWRPWFETCIEAFGADRCMFESNFPVDKGSCSYTTLWNAFKTIASGASASEKANLFHDTAARIYRLPA
ncbi:MAG: amidohydrolase family protein [Hyphomicrobiales bacterium]|nr:amidohydrolase family protein [Hyphomicrobiales bacterium]